MEWPDFPKVFQFLKNWFIHLDQYKERPAQHIPLHCIRGKSFTEKILDTIPVLAFHSINPARQAGQVHYIPPPKGDGVRLESMPLH